MKRINIIAFSLLTIAFSSCKKDFLNTEPTGAVSEEQTFSTTAGAKSVINGVYRYLYSRYDGQNMPGQGGIMLQLDFMGEDIHQAQSTWYTASGSGTGGWVSHRNDASGYVSYPFRLYYRCIGNANAIIDYIAKADGPDSEKNTVKGEALAMRAWSYFNLVQIFAKRYDAAAKPNNQLGISLALSAKDIKLKRSTVEEVYTQINKDLDEAITLLGTALPSGTSKSHLSGIAAKAIKARVALTMQDYTAAASLAKQVVDAGGFSLMTTAQYQTGFNDIINPEWIWGAYIQPDQGDTFGSFFGQISYDGNTTYIRSRPKRINSALYGKISATDVRKKMWEPTPNATNFPLPLATFVREAYMSRKFAIKAANTTLGDVPYIRLAEMYLIMAEAYAQIPGKETAAQDTLFTFVSKRDPGYVKSTNTGQALIDEILLHRRVEFWGEGFRFYDLKRLNQDLDRTVVPNFASVSVAGLMKVPAGDNRWQFAIPIGEIQANPNTAPNP